MTLLAQVWMFLLESGEPGEKQRFAIARKTENGQFGKGIFMWKHGLVTLGLVTMTFGQLHAQGLSLGPQFGYQKSRAAAIGNVMIGGALRLKLSSSLGVEGSVNYREESYGNGAVTVRNWPIMATGLVYPLPFLYGAIGAGWYNTTFDYDPSKIPGQTVSNETKQRV